LSDDDRIARPRARTDELRRRRRLAAVAVLVAGAAAVVVAVVAGSASDGSRPNRAVSAPVPEKPVRHAARSPAGPLPGTETAGNHRAANEPVPILMYHVIGYVKPDTPSQELWVSPSEFAAEMRALARAGYHGVTLQRVWDAWHKDGLLPSKPIVISFDDGYYGQYRDARPTLRRLGWPGVLNLKLNNLADMGGVANIKRMVADGWEVDDHTIAHPDLTTLSPAQLHEEIAVSRARFRRLFGVPVNFFCYPAGRYDQAVIGEVRRAGYLGATTTLFGYARPGDTYTLARVRVNRSDGVAGVLRSVRQLGADPAAAPSGGIGE
jgi:peptidoglycan/xylan/chitin deacetylase (PgdA/CDA1 family)